MRLMTLAVTTVFFTIACGGDSSPKPTPTDTSSDTSPDAGPDTACQPQCADKSCGDDGCGGNCGTCENEETCSDTGQCEGPCVPSCPFISGFGTEVECGDDGCGGQCGAGCDADSHCVSAKCILHGAWTILVYMVADNDLEGDAMQDLEEMIQVQIPDNVHLIVQIDRLSADDAWYSTWHPPYWDNNEGIGDLPAWTTAKRLRIEKNSALPITDLGEVNCSDPDVLQNFLSWGLTTYRSDRYAVILWDHGAGWTSFGVDWSEDTRNTLTASQINSALSGALATADVERLDLLGFDACLMGNYEVASTLAGTAKTFIASEEIEPGTGWDWTALNAVASNPSMDGVQLAFQIANGYMAAYSDGWSNLTMSIIDMTKIPDLQVTLSKLANELQTRMNELLPLIGAARNETMSFGGQMELYDLGDFISLLEDSDATLNNLGSQVLESYDKVVLKAHTGLTAGRATGLTIHFPNTFIQPEYEQMESATDWHAMLTSFIDGLAALPEGLHPEFTSVNAIATAAQEGDGTYLVTAPMKEGTELMVANINLLYGTKETDKTINLFVQVDGWLEGNLATGQTTDIWLQMKQGDRISRVFAVEEIGNNGLIEYTAELDYFVSEDATSSSQVQWTIIFKQSPQDGSYTLVSSSMVVGSEVINLFTGLSYLVYTELNPGPGSRLVPTTLQYQENADDLGVWPFERVGLNTEFDAQKYIGVSLIPASIGPNEKLAGVIKAVDVAGKWDAAHFTVAP